MPHTPISAEARRPAQPPRGAIAPPGDKSISHRALIFGGLAVGRTDVTGLLEGEDVLATAAAMRALGAQVERTGPGAWTVEGAGADALAEPAAPLDLGNSGTGARLLRGVVAGAPVTAIFTGDASLSRRPMARVLDPLRRMGAEALGRSGDRLPLALRGSADPMAIEHHSAVASAQVKSAILLAGLNAAGRTTVIEPARSRDHTENMLRAFGAEVTVDGLAVHLTGGAELKGAPVAVPADPSSAAFAAALAAATPGAEATLTGVGMNPLRAGFFDSLLEMGAQIEIRNPRETGGEPVADLHILGGELRAIDTPPERAPTMIDEYPILAVCAAVAAGRSRMRGLEELRVKESDRLTLMAEGLAACGVKTAIEGDDLIVEGAGGPPPGGATISASLDHRIAMSFLVLGLLSQNPVRVDDASPVATSYPGFFEDMAALGAPIEQAESAAA